VIYDDAPPDPPLRESVVDLRTVGEAVFVVTYDTEQSGYVTRGYDSGGTPTWTRVEQRWVGEGAGIPLALDDGTLLWIDNIEESIRVRTLDDRGLVVTECTAPADGNAVSDVDLAGDELLVVTIDRITRLRLGPPLAR
jgi:hypothetical protein